MWRMSAPPVVLQSGALGQAGELDPAEDTDRSASGSGVDPSEELHDTCGNRIDSKYAVDDIHRALSDHGSE